MWCCEERRTLEDPAVTGVAPASTAQTRQWKASFRSGARKSSRKPCEKCGLRVRRRPSAHLWRATDTSPTTTTRATQTAAAEAASLVSDGHLTEYRTALATGDAAEAASLVSDGHSPTLLAMRPVIVAAEAASLVRDGHQAEW